MHDRQDHYDIISHNEEDQIRKPVDFCEAYWRNVKWEELRLLLDLIESPIDLLAESVSQCRRDLFVVGESCDEIIRYSGMKP